MKKIFHVRLPNIYDCSGSDVISEEFEFDDDCEEGVIQSAFVEWIIQNSNCGIEDMEE